MTAPGLHCCTWAAWVRRGVPGVGPVAVAHRLHGPAAWGSDCPEQEWGPCPCLGRRTLNPWATGESPVGGRFGDNQSDWCEVRPRFEFGLRFSNTSAEPLFTCLSTICMSCLEERPFRPSNCCLTGPFVWMILSLTKCVWILETTAWSAMSLAAISSHSVGCLFVWLGFLCCADAVELNEVPFVYFCFSFHYSGSQIGKDTVKIYVRECSAYVFL